MNNKGWKFEKGVASLDASKPGVRPVVEKFVEETTGDLAVVGMAICGICGASVGFFFGWLIWG